MKKILCVDPLECNSTFVVMYNSQFIDYSFRSSHTIADTRIIFHTKCLESIRSDECSIIVESLIQFYSWKIITLSVKTKLLVFTGKTSTTPSHFSWPTLYFKFVPRWQNKNTSWIFFYLFNYIITLYLSNYISTNR